MMSDVRFAVDVERLEREVREVAHEWTPAEQWEVAHTIRDLRRMAGLPPRRMVAMAGRIVSLGVRP